MYKNIMKKLNLSTQKFIKKNIKINSAASSSYPQRVVTPVAAPTIDDSTELVTDKHKAKLK
ncbi:MAG: hypothetical protein ACPG52_08230 [Cognaticolwellia sp.]